MITVITAWPHSLGADNTDAVHIQGNTSDIRAHVPPSVAWQGMCSVDEQRRLLEHARDISDEAAHAVTVDNAVIE